MTTSRFLLTVILGLSFYIIPNVSISASCDSNCESKCPRIAGVVEPVCKNLCKAAKKKCLPLPPLFPSLDPKKAIGDICAAEFQKWTSKMASACQLTAGFHITTPDLAGAMDVLINSGEFKKEEFNGVSVKFCNLPGGNGFTPSGTTIFLSNKTRSWTSYQLAPLLAHEMFHVRQYVSKGYDAFACEYFKQVAKGRGTLCSNSLEKPAYEFECKFAKDIRMTNRCICSQPGPAPIPNGKSEPRIKLFEDADDGRTF